MNNDKKIKILIKNVYGKETIYPVCEQAVIFSQLLHQKTLTKKDIQTIKLLGYTIEVIQEKVSF